MAKSNFLGEFEQMVMLAVLRLDDEAYGVPIHDEIERVTGRDTSRGAVYVTLDRLEKKGYLRSWMSDPRPERGGRSRRCYELEPGGVEALEQSRSALRALWRGVELPSEAS